VKLLTLFGVGPDLTAAIAGIVGILAQVADLLELLVEIDEAAVRQPGNDDDVQGGVEDLAQCGVAGAQAGLDALYLRDVPEHRNHARLTIDFDHRGRDQLRLVDGAIFAALGYFHVLDAPGSPNALEELRYLFFVPPRPKGDHVGPHHVVAGVTADPVIVVDGNETSVGKAVDRDVVRRRFEYLAQHRLACLQLLVIAFQSGCGLRAQVHLAPEQTIVLGQGRQLLGQFPAIAGSKDRTQLG